MIKLRGLKAMSASPTISDSSSSTSQSPISSRSRSSSSSSSGSSASSSEESSSSSRSSSPNRPESREEQDADRGSDLVNQIFGKDEEIEEIDENNNDDEKEKENQDEKSLLIVKEDLKNVEEGRGGEKSDPVGDSESFNVCRRVSEVERQEVKNEEGEKDEPKDSERDLLLISAEAKVVCFFFFIY